MIRIETQLRPRAFGEVLDVALESLRRDFPVIVTLSLLVNAPLAATILALLYGVTVLGRATAGFVAPLAFAAAALVLLRPLAQGAISVALATRIESGRGPTVLGAAGRALRRALPIAFGGLMFWVAALVGGMLYVVPGLFLSSHWSLAVPVAALEPKSPFEALGRAGKLLKGRGAGAMGLMLLLVGIYVMLTVNAFLAVAGALLAGRYLFGLETGYYEAILTPENGLYATALLLAIYLVVEPWKACAFYHLYLDGRVRLEAVDLWAAVERVTAGTAAAPPEVEPALAGAKAP